MNDNIPRPTERSVTMKLLREWVPDAARGTISPYEAWRIIRAQYCRALIGRGVCPLECEQCRAEIVDMFRLERAENPARLLTWLAKDHSARMIEKLIAAEKDFPAHETPPDPFNALFPKREPENLFLELLKDYV